MAAGAAGRVNTVSTRSETGCVLAGGALGVWHELEPAIGAAVSALDKLTKIVGVVVTSLPS